MSREAGSCQWESTRPIAWRGLVVEGTAWEPGHPELARLDQEARGETRDQERQRRRGEPRRRPPPDADHHRPERRTGHGAQAGHGREPAQALGALFGRRGIGHVRLHHPDGAAAQPLHQAGEEQYRHRSGEGEDDVGAAGEQQPGEDGGPAAVAVGEAAPHRGHGQLGHREGRDQQAHHRRAGTQLGGVERQQGDDHGEPHHVHERRHEQHQQSRHGSRLPCLDMKRVEAISTRPGRAGSAAVVLFGVITAWRRLKYLSAL